MINNISLSWVPIILVSMFAGLIGYYITKPQYKKETVSFKYWNLVVALFSFLVLVLSAKFGLVQFGGYDSCCITDPAWRIILGQRPNIDFPCTVPPGFYLGSTLAFKTFGVSWSSIVFINALYGMLTFLWSYWLLALVFGDKFLSLVLAFVLQASNSILCGFWWYNQPTYLAACLYFLSAILLIQKTGLSAARISYVGSLVILVLMKPNTAFIEIMGSTFFMIIDRKMRPLILRLSLFAVIFYFAICAISRVNIKLMLLAYSSISERAFTFHQFIVNWKTIPALEKISLLVIWLWISLVLIYCFKKSGKKLFADLQSMLSLILVTTGIFATISDGENRLSNASILILGVCFLASRAGQSETQYWNLKFKRFILIFLFAICGLGLAEGYARIRVWGIGPNAFFQFANANEQIPGKFFHSLTPSPLFVDLNRELKYLLFSNEVKKVWFGPRLQWAYAAFKIAPEINQPSWWEAGVSYPKKDEKEYVEKWDSLKYDTVVLYRGDTTYLPPSLIEKMVKNYSVDQNYNILTVLHRKPSS